MSLIPKKGTVYVVDDDEAVRDSLQWLQRPFDVEDSLCGIDGLLAR